MMKRTPLILGALTLSAITTLSAPISPEEALSRLESGPQKISGISRTHSVQLERTDYTESGEVATYLFRNGDNGFLLLSADDVAYPLLGYGDSGEFDLNNISPTMSWWIGEYGRQIEYARTKGIENVQQSPVAYEDMAPIAPMLTTKWNQDAPYNDLCPLSGGQTTHTGCVATSMAQVMNYFKYPEVGQGTIQYTPASLGRRLSLAFSRQAFDWDNMLDVYSRGAYTEEQSAAVAYLMKACGYSVKMNYTTEASGAQGQAVASSAITYFKYDEGAHSKYRDIYPTSEWVKMVYDNLKNVGPMVMNGQAPDGGHSFVCDGYDGKGYFHFNWGWGGSSDGYFALDALSPAGIGIGGYEGGFNYDQDAIFGMQPPTGKPVEKVYSNMFLYGYAKGDISGKTLSIKTVGEGMIGWGNVSSFDISVKIGAAVEPLSGGEQTVIPAQISNKENLSLQIGTYFPGSNSRFVTTLPDLADGEYRVTVMTQDNSVENAPWQPIQVTWSYPNCVKVTVKDGIYCVEDVAIPSIQINNVMPTGNVYANRYTYLKGDFINNNEIELTRTVVASLYDGEQECLTSSAYVVTMQPGENEEHEWLTKFVPVSGYRLTEEKEFQLRLSDSKTGAYYGEFGTVKVKPAGTQGVPVITGAKIENATGLKDVELGGETYINVSMLPGKDIEATFSYKINRGFFDGVVTASIYRLAAPGSNVLVPVVENFYEDRPMLERNTTKTIQLDYEFDEAVGEELYYIVLRYSTGTYYSTLAQLPFMTDTSGIDEIKTETGEVVEYYNLQGFKVESPVKGEIIIERIGTKSRKIIF